MKSTRETLPCETSRHQECPDTLWAKKWVGDLPPIPNGSWKRLLDNVEETHIYETEHIYVTTW
jgi:hypothetical protein